MPNLLITLQLANQVLKLRRQNMTVRLNPPTSKTPPKSLPGK
jgi:hypothetical protein